MESATAREVPAYEVTAYASKRHRYCVAIFVINEGEKLLRQLDRMRALAEEVDLLVADGGSSDGSTSRSNLAPGGVRALLTKTGPGGLPPNRSSSTR